MTTNRSLRRKQRTHKSASMVATSLLATSALLGTYLGNPRLGRAYATGVCTVENASDFNRYIVNTDCDIIYITENFTATDFSRAIGGDGDERTSLTINGVGEGITITGGGIAAFSLLDNENSVLSLTISNLTITGFRSTGEGGAIYTTGDVTVTNSIFSGNLAGTSGGAIYTNGDVIVTNSIFSGNDAVDYGGAIYAFSGIGTNYVTVTNSTFSDNSATEQYGGAIYTGSVKVTNSTLVVTMQNMVELYLPLVVHLLLTQLLVRIPLVLMVVELYLPLVVHLLLTQLLVRIPLVIMVVQLNQLALQLLPTLFLVRIPLVLMVVQSILRMPAM